MAINQKNKVETLRPFFSQRKCPEFRIKKAWGQGRGVCGIYEDSTNRDKSCILGDQADFVLMGADGTQKITTQDVKDRLKLSFIIIRTTIPHLAEASRCPFVTSESGQNEQDVIVN